MSNTNDSSMNNTPESTTVYHQGGAVGVTFGRGHADEDVPNVDGFNQAPADGRLVVANDGSIQTEALGVTKVNIGADMAERRANSDSILATARSPWGGRATSLNPSTVVMVGGIETSLGAAEQMGLVYRNADGNYVEVHSGNQSGNQGAQQGQPQGANELDTSDDSFEVPEPILNEINRVIEPLPQSTWEASVHKVLHHGIDSLDFNQLAEHMQTTPDVARKAMSDIYNVYAHHAAQALKGTVADPVETLNWLQAEKPREFARAMVQLVMGAKTGDLKALAKTFERSTNPDDASLKAAGFETSVARDGTRMIRYQNRWVALSTAVKNGWV